MELYMYLYMELIYMSSMKLLLARMYLSNICLRKLVDYQWNTIFILERLSAYTDDWKELDRIIRLQP